MLTAALVTYSHAWSSVGTLKPSDRCGDKYDASAFVCRNTWMTHLKTNYR
jgi:hypothetical protein